MPKNIRQKVVFKKTKPQVLYAALMDDKKHGKISGGRAHIGKKAGDTFSACDGYCLGVQLALEKGKRIVQAWRGSDWPAGHYSVAIFEFAPRGKGAVLTFTQYSVPDKFFKDTSQGWKEYYWQPMKEMFGE